MNLPGFGASVLSVMLNDSGDFAVRAAEQPRVVQAVPLQLGQIDLVVEVEVQHRAVVLAGRDDDRRLAAPQEIVRIVGVQRERLGGLCGRRSKCCEKQHPSHSVNRASHNNLRGLRPWWTIDGGSLYCVPHGLKLDRCGKWGGIGCGEEIER